MDLTQATRIELEALPVTQLRQGDRSLTVDLRSPGRRRRRSGQKHGPS